jgi:predicted lipoprotein with Yx(FWY)xxD motif
MQTPRKMITRVYAFPALLVAAAIAATACSSSPSPASAPAKHSGSPAAAKSSAAAGVTIATATTSLGAVLTDGKGITVYLFEGDTGTKSTCYGACATAWPPVLTTGAPLAGSGAKAPLLGTTKRSDGATQVTYAGHPLYYFSGSTKAGQVNGQGLHAFGAGWDAVRPNGAQAG